jgi:hypothetical protein
MRSNQTVAPTHQALKSQAWHAGRLSVMIARRIALRSLVRVRQSHSAKKLVVRCTPIVSVA